MGENDLSEIKNDMKEIKKLLLGNGAIGVAEMARRTYEWMVFCKATRNGRLDWAFRAIIMIVVSYIAYKVGIRGG